MKICRCCTVTLFCSLFLSFLSPFAAHFFLRKPFKYLLHFSHCSRVQPNTFYARMHIFVQQLGCVAASSPVNRRPLLKGRGLPVGLCYAPHSYLIPVGHDRFPRSAMYKRRALRSEEVWAVSSRYLPPPSSDVGGWRAWRTAWQVVTTESAPQFDHWTVRTATGVIKLLPHHEYRRGWIRRAPFRIVKTQERRVLFSAALVQGDQR